ncbi:MAG: lipopolysaccharide kinase InaA family protein [Salinimicrobium sediminis]|nr:lipopolysaccharide kinase InaA family protein [Salinimicrobium sediminis]
MKLVISENFSNSREEILDLVNHFEDQGEKFGAGVRNKIKLFELQGITVNVKAFKVPNTVNKIAYRFFRKSKAERSFKYAQKLLEKGIGTPRPIAYLEEINPLTFVHSYYISEHLSYDLTYRELVQQSDYPDHEKILRAFTRFTWKLHENGVEFLDHSPGNTLIRLNKGDYQFFLVDLNRMNFKNLSLEERMKNFSRLTPQKDMVRVMASEYSKLISQPEEKIFEKMWGYTKEFQKDFQKKKALKKKIKFWKK